MKNKAAKQKSKRKGSENAFGCDLTEHLQTSGHEVPQVLKTCAEFIEHHGIVDGIYRLSGITSNIQRLRQEFMTEQSPDLTKEVYLQDIHCVGSLCKLYFRELPNPLLTYELYQKFTDAVSVKGEDEQLRNVQQVIEELPVAHFRTLEFLTKHLAHLATLSHQTNMHTRNLALVWAPNLLRSKEIEVSACNGDEAFLEVRVQQSVVEFILNHTEQIFNHTADTPRPKEGASVMCVEKYATLPAISQCPPMKLMSLEEAQARSLGPNHPARIERQRENSLPDTTTTAMYHTVIELSENKRKFSAKSKKWKSIFSLGRSVTDAKGKLSRNGSVFMRAQNISEKPGIRPSKSMDSLCSLPTDDEKSASTRGPNGLFAPVVKSRTLGSDIYDPNEQDPDWEFDLRKASGVIGGGPGAKTRGPVNPSSSSSPSTSSSSSSPLQRALPEQLKVFKGDEIAACRPTSPKNRRMLYSGSSHNGASRPSFPGSLFPLESSPRHQRKALNISEPFAVSVPLRVSAVISSNSTPCRVAGKERERSLGGLLKPNESSGFREPLPSNSGNFDVRDKDRTFGGRENPPGNSSGHGIYSNSSSVPIEESHSVERGAGVIPSDRVAESNDAEIKELLASVEGPPLPKTRETDVENSQSLGKELESTSTQLNGLKTLDRLNTGSTNQELWSDVHHELRITESDANVLQDQLKASGSMSKITLNNGALNHNAQAKRRSSLPAQPVSTKEHFKDVIKGLVRDHAGATRFNPKPRPSAESLTKHENDWNYLDSADEKDHKGSDTFEPLHIVAHELRLSPFFHLKETDILQDAEPWVSDSAAEDPAAFQVIKNDDSNTGVAEPCVQSTSLSEDKNTQLSKDDDHVRVKDVVRDLDKDKTSSVEVTAKTNSRVQRLSEFLDERRLTTEIPGLDDDDIWGSHLAGLDQVEPWEDLSTTKDWVTSPLHTTKMEDLFPLFTAVMPRVVAENKAPTESSIKLLQHDEVVGEGSSLLNVPVVPKERSDITAELNPELLSLAPPDKMSETEERGLGNITKPSPDSNFEGIGEKAETKQDIPQLAPFPSTVHQEEMTRMPKRNIGAPKQKSSVSSQRFFRQVSHEPCIAEKNEENIAPKHRPYSLNLDLGHRCIRDISNRQNLDLVDPSSYQRGSVTPKHDGLPLELEMFLRDRQAPMRRNSAPVSVSSVRTAFMIKTCQAKAVPVIPPKIQYSLIPNPVLEKEKIHEQEKRSGPEREGGPDKTKVEKSDSFPPFHVVKDLKEERENCKPVPRIQRQASVEKSSETFKSIPAPEFPVLRRKRSSNGDSFMDCPRPERSTLHQRSSFRNRPRPQSLILFSPPFPIMDYHPVGDDSKLALSPIKSPAETPPLDVLTKDLAENLKTPEGVTLRNKMTMPKSGQRLETSTSCFYQPQRRSMIFDNRNSRQIE